MVRLIWEPMKPFLRNKKGVHKGPWVPIILATGLVLAFYAGTPHSVPGRSDNFRLMFYNVENLFDTLDHPLPGDDEYTPSGRRAWNGWKYRQKLHRIFQVVVAAGGWEPPELIGLCEVENRQVVEDLFTKTPLVKYPWGIVHVESPDERGIDVALAYRKDAFEPAGFESWQLTDGDGHVLATRPVLYVRGEISCTSSLHIILVHWPSRFNPPEHRMRASIMVAGKIDSLLQAEPDAYIILTGDLNDNPDDPAAAYLTRDSVMINLAAGSAGMQGGTLKYEGRWYAYDQIMVSRSLLSEKGLRWKEGSFRVIRETFMVKEDNRFPGVEPFRTFEGYRYAGGYSDHLPVVADFVCLP